MTTKTTLGQIAALLNVDLVDATSAALEIVGLAPLDQATRGHIGFFAEERERTKLQGTKAAAVIVHEQDKAACPTLPLVVPNVRVAFAQLAAHFDATPVPAPGVHEASYVHESVTLSEGASIGPGAVIAAGVTVGQHAAVGANCVVDEGVHIGAGTVLKPNVTVNHGVRIGESCIIHSGAVLGSDGFGLAHDDKGHWQKIPQLGTVVLGDRVEIGSNTTIDRGALGDTILGDGVKLDNQIQVGHNVQIGPHTVIAGCVAIGGSTHIGAHCMIGGFTAVTGHISIADGTVVTGGSSVSKTISKKGVYSSSLAVMPSREWLKILAQLRQLPKRLTTKDKV